MRSLPQPFRGMTRTLVIPRRLLVQWDMYHPTWNDEVIESRWNRLPIVVFPALLRVHASRQIDQFFKDICRARATRCDACVRAHRTCVVHNLWPPPMPEPRNGDGALRDFHILPLQVGLLADICMVVCGYPSPPSCLPYDAAKEHNIIIVPTGALCADRTSQPLTLLNQPLVHEADPEGCLEDGLYDELDFDLDSDSEAEGRGDQAEQPSKKTNANSSDQDHHRSRAEQTVS
ncbi:hypothetical protein L227DRAFT_615720 [Lentinus tigrinus ALCF2SS1-6]|uniref:Uncharacterized protein n=1 Tax=Lentinus tigrinus ALCF2SS1-6 TaxID=1328759 RepID=A0A5C2RTU0_9APHY|nr:hypothetical protein L227DRAFT_615720 [Lentinus tigrinus ALCF2SS1-6]